MIESIARRISPADSTWYSDPFPLSALSAASIRRSFLARAILFGVAYVGCAGLGHFLSYHEEAYWPFWPPNGLLLGVLIASERRQWPVFLVTTLPASLISDLLFEGYRTDLVPLALAIWLANTLEALLAAVVVRRILGERITLSNTREFLIFVAIGALAAPAIGATLGAFAVDRAQELPFTDAWLRWWIGDAVGVLVVAPVIITWCGADMSPRILRAPRAYVLEYLLYCVVMLLIAENVFHRHPSDEAMAARFPFFLMTPLMLWAGFRFEPRGASLSVLLLAIVVIWCTTRGFGSVARYGNGVIQQGLLLQGLVAQASCLTLLFSSSIERRELAETRLQQALSEIKTLKGLIPICSNCKKIRNDHGAWERLESYMSTHTDAEFTHGVCPECCPLIFGVNWSQPARDDAP